MATGFLGAGAHTTQITPTRSRRTRYDELDDMATTRHGVLGLHRLRPLPRPQVRPDPQADYYRLLSAFTTTVRSEMDMTCTPSAIAKRRPVRRRAHAVGRCAGRVREGQLPARLRQWLEARRTGRSQEDRWHVRKHRRRPGILRGGGPCCIRLAETAYALGDARRQNARRRGKRALQKCFGTLDPDWQRSTAPSKSTPAGAAKPKLAKVMLSATGSRPFVFTRRGRTSSKRPTI